MKLPTESGVWDAVVVGAGPSGAATAHALARSGLRTLLVDRNAFPRFKVCGGCISARSLDRFDALGLGTAVAALPGIPLSGFQVSSAGGKTMHVDLPGGISVTRAALDQALVDAAVASGVSFRPGLHARVQCSESDSAGTRPVLLTGMDGETERVEARVVVAADGLGHPSLAGLPGFRSSVRRCGYIGVGALLPAVGDYPAGTIYMGVGRGGYVGLVRVWDGRMNVAAALDPGQVRVHHGIGPAIAGLIREAGLPSVPGLAVERWRATPRLTRRSRSVAAHRILVVGDAASYVEPFTGEGIAWALSDAAHVSAILGHGVARWTPAIERAWASARRRTVVNEQTFSRGLSALLRLGATRSLVLRAGGRFPDLVARTARLTCAP